MQGSLEEDFAALRKLRDDDESGALKEFFGDGEDPREWFNQPLDNWDVYNVTGGRRRRPCVAVADGRVTELYLQGCSKLTALPAAIGDLKALTDLDLRGCSSLAALPDEIRGLGALTGLDLYGCSSLAALPAAIGELKALAMLDLEKCSSLVMLPAAIGELQALTRVDLSSTRIAELPAAIGALGALKELRLVGCESLAALPDAIGELGALENLDLKGCSSLESLPDSIDGRDGLTVVLPDQLNGPLQEDFAALRKLRDESECDELKQAWSGEDPRVWRFEYEGEQQPCVIVEDGRVKGLGLSFASLAVLPDAIGDLKPLRGLTLYGCSSLAELPAAIGELKALTTLELSGCSKLVALPDSIGKLSGITELNLRGCSSLERLPDGIDGREGLEVKLPLQLENIPAPLAEDFAALRKLRDDDESGALKECFGDDEDPREWNDGDAVTVQDGRVTKLSLYKCSSLVVLPAAIGELKALTTLNLNLCSSLVALPEAISVLKALVELNLYNCSSLVALPAAIGELNALTELNLINCSSLVALPESIGGLDALTTLDLGGCSSLTALPAAIGELKALTGLGLHGCSSLAELPAAIGELGALTELYLKGCSSLGKLPEGVVGREGLKVTLPFHLMILNLPAPLREDLVALRKLRDDDESDVLKEAWTDEDPREWRGIEVADGRVTAIGFPPSLAALPDSIGKLGALMTLDLRDCSNLFTLPAAIGELVSLKTLYCTLSITLPESTINIKELTLVRGSLDEDFAALRKLRDNDESGALKECLGDDEDPREWKNADGQNRVTVADGRVTELFLYECTKLTALPDAIGELGALTKLDLMYCSSLAALPDAIGELKALTTLNLWGCSSLAALPAAIGELKALTTLSLSGCSSLAALPAAIGKLRALRTLDLRGCSSLAALPDAIGKLKALTALDLLQCSKLAALPDAIGELGALTKLDLMYCSSLAALPDAIGELGALTELCLSGCSSLAALPDAIGKLKALTALDLYNCSSLVALPESIGGLDALTTLDLIGCNKLTFPPPHTHQDGTERIKRLLANTNRFLANEISAVDADDDAKADFLDGAIRHAPFADRLEEAVRRDPALAKITNAEGVPAIELADHKCRRAMQKALFFLGHYEIADGAPEHRSATSLVVRALDYEAAEDYGKLFNEFDKDSNGLMDADELKALAAGLGTNIEVFKLAGGESYTRKEFVAKCQRLFGKERKVVIKVFQVEEQWRNEKRGRDDQQLDARYVVQTIEAPDDNKFEGALRESRLFQEKRFGGSVGTRAIVMDAADRNLFQIYQSERPDLNAVRFLMEQVMRCVDHVHTQGLVHGDIKMLNIVRLSLDQRLRLIDLDAAVKICEIDSGGSYVGLKFSSAVLPPECFAKLDADQVAQFESYFKGDADSWDKASPADKELWEKVAPKVDNRGTSYVVNEKSKSKDKESSETVRGASLRELKEFFEANPKAKNYAGLRRIGDPNDGTAIWTKVKDEDLEATLEVRAAERLAEEKLRREELVDSDRALDLKPAADEPLPSVTPTNAASQSHVDAKGEDVTGDLDAIDGTDPKEVEAALEARAQERRAETKRGEDDYAAYLRKKAAGDAEAAAGAGARADAGGATAATTAAPAAGSGPSAVRALTAAPREAGDPEALRRVEDRLTLRLTGIEEQLGAIRSIEAGMSRSLLRLSQ